MFIISSLNSIFFITNKNNRYTDITEDLRREMINGLEIKYDTEEIYYNRLERIFF